MTFRKKAEKIISKGKTVSKAQSLADLHRRRKETQSQYFTPVWVAEGIWQSFGNLSQQARQKNKILHVVDSNCGNGRLFEGAPLDCVSLHGLDIDQHCIEALITDTQKMDNHHHFETGCISELDFSNFDIAVINPAYSIHIESPNLTNYDTNYFGKFGPSTSAFSHEYALAQALSGASAVAAILPVSIDVLARKYKRLMAVVYLPGNTFVHEGANVKTAVYFFSPEPCSQVQEYNLAQGEEWPVLSLSRDRYLGKPSFKMLSYDSSVPTISLPVTGNRKVELHHHNRRVVLKFHCGLTQAKVLNSLYRSNAQGKRLPRSIKYSGQGQLLLDVLLLQDDNHAQLELLANKINLLGGQAWISPTLANYYKKLVKRHDRATMPFYRMVKGSNLNHVNIIAKKRCLLNPEDFSSPTIKKGQFVRAVPKGGEYIINLNDYSVCLRRDELLKRFEFATTSDLEVDKEWSLLHKGLSKSYPELAKMHKTVISNAGIDWLADFQLTSLIEGLINPYGYIGAWEQGSGKARYAIALALLHSGKNLIVVESGLLPEMIREFEKLEIPESLWGILNNGDMPSKKVNLVTYRTLRTGTKICYQKDVFSRGQITTKQKTKVMRTNGQKWKRLFNTVICDEGGLLSNLHTQQTKAVKSLNARKLVVLDGTPQRNYPRNLLPLAVASAGNGLSHQRYGVKGKSLLQPRMIESCDQIQRGEDAFYDNHVVTQWVTNEFKEDLQAGGKREVPKINNLNLFRKWLAPNIQRRLRSEPDLEVFANCPTPTREVFTCAWDKEHLHHYLKIATEFSQWYKNNKGNTKALNMVTILARINAVQKAANAPHVVSKSSHSQYSPITSKQRLAIKRIKHHVNSNKKIILYASSPEVLERLYIELKEQNIDSVLFTGKQNIAARAKELDSEFRFGKTQVLLSSWVGQRGLNLEQASVVLFYERNWSATTEEQAIFRTQRPSQLEQVAVEYLHLKGSIDEYCAQLVEWKSKAADAGLDFGDQVDEVEEFLHLDTILTRFCESVYEMSVHETKDFLCDVA